MQWKRIWNSLVDKLTESGDYRALPEREGGKDALPPTGKESHI